MVVERSMRWYKDKKEFLHSLNLGSGWREAALTHLSPTRPASNRGSGSVPCQREGEGLGARGS